MAAPERTLQQLKCLLLYYSPLKYETFVKKITKYKELDFANGLSNVLVRE